MNLSLFIAKRIYNNQGDKQKVSRPVISIATIGVAIGLAVMIITVSVVFGFKHTIRDKVIGFSNHIQVANFLTLQGAGHHPVHRRQSGAINICHRGCRQDRQIYRRSRNTQNRRRFQRNQFQGHRPAIQNGVPSVVPYRWRHTAIQRFFIYQPTSYISKHCRQTSFERWR